MIALAKDSNSMNLWVRLGTVLAILFIGPVTAWACFCADSGPPCEMAWKADVVFAGTVLSITEPPVPTVTGGSSIGRQLQSAPPQPTPFRKRTVRVQVAEALKGIAPGQAEIEIVTGLGGGDCGYNFQAGTAYVIYGYRTPEGIDVGICSRTRPLADAAEDLAYLRAVPTLPDTGVIYVIAGPPFRPPLSGVRTTINGEGSQTAASTVV